jgi:beta propeller repeat protein
MKTRFHSKVMTQLYRHALNMKCLVSVILLLLLGVFEVAAQQQFQGVCSRVRIVIEQELTLERIGFEARLEVTNNDGQDPITDFFASLTFQTTTSGTNVGGADASQRFFVQSPTFENLNSVDGAGVIGPTTKSVVRWFIIPKISAGGVSPEGLRYSVGCTLSGKIRGSQIPGDVLFAIPSTITVKPDPQLDITYFQPRDVQGDDPFTPEVESPIPFTLGVLVKNSGYGPARKLKIDSKQPKIVENINGLLLVAQLLGARVGDTKVLPTSLVVNLGDINPATTKKGSWDMITSLSGEFIEFKASYTHASELGGEETSVIKSLNAYFISHEVFDDQPGRDALKDFLADVVDDPDLIPDTLFESEGNTLPVNHLTNAVVVGSAGPGGSFQVQLTQQVSGWGYIRLTDPGQAKLPIASVVRSDGKVLNTNNAWTNFRYTKIGNIRQNWLNLLDAVELKDYTYTVTYAQTVADVTAPVTTMHFAGSVDANGGKYYITPQTQIYFISEDISPVSMFYSLNGVDFQIALPFTLPNAGEYPIVFYSRDSSNNREVNKTNIVVVSGAGGLGFANVTSPTQPIFASGDAVSIRPLDAPFTFQAANNPSQVDARVEIFQGVIGWAAVSGTPSSPTADTTATLAVSGPIVDYYKYRLNNGAWSAERSVATSIQLSGLSAGLQKVEVLGRSQYGGYSADTNSASVSWTVNPAAPATRITGAPASPTKSDVAALNIAGTGVTAYRWNLNNSYYRVETNAPGTLMLSATSPTQQVVNVAVIGKISGTYQPQANPTTVSWLYDPLFGYGVADLPLVRSYFVTNIGASSQTFVWDGRNNSGAVLPSGWYTVRITLQDALGRTNFSTRLVQIGNPSGVPGVLADVARGPRNPYARGGWAVWQDQSATKWDIYAQRLGAAPAIQKLTTTPLNQENPQTDGRYAVWQGRQTNGNWEIYLKDLETAAPLQALTASPDVDEINPAIDWPWVVWQRRSSANPSAPWQVLATNLLSGQRFLAWGSTQDQLNPSVQAGRVVWQDWRDVGPGEIYFRNLESSEQRRITTNTFGQYNPVLNNQWIVWQDNRNGQVDLYGFDIGRNTEVRLTATPENETRPYLDGPWAVYQEDSLSPLTANLRLLHLPTLRTVPVTRTTTAKDRPSLANGKALWLETVGGLASVQSVDVPSLQAVFQNRNAVAITEAMATYQQTAHKLLKLWNAQAGVTQIGHYTSLVPQVNTEVAIYTNGAATGPNFNLVPGDFLWIKFPDNRIVDLGVNAANPLNFAAGPSVFSYSGFPSQYSAFKFLNQLGVAKAKSVRMLDAESGRWVVALMQNGRPIGADFPIPNVAVLMVDLASAANNFRPQ